MREYARLRRTRDVARVRAEGVSRGDRMFLVVAAASDVGRSRIAVSAPARLGTAVARNRARRRARAAFLPFLALLRPPADLLVTVRGAALHASFAELAGSARALLRSHGLLAEGA